MRKPKLHPDSVRECGDILDGEWYTIACAGASTSTVWTGIDEHKVFTTDILAAIRDAKADPVFTAVENLLREVVPTPESIEGLRKAYLDATEESE
jgi:hypothetical protein